MIDDEDDPLLAALAALPSPTMPEPRAEAIRLNARTFLEPETRSFSAQAARALMPIAFAVYAVVYLGWTLERVTQNSDDERRPPPAHRS